jgi:hypothetical protein
MILIVSVVLYVFGMGMFLSAFFQFALMSFWSAIAGVGLVLLGMIAAWGGTRALIMALTERSITVEKKGILYVETFGRKAKEEMIDFSWITSVDITEFGGLEIIFEVPGTHKWKAVGLMKSEISDALIRELDKAIGVQEAY